MSTRTQPPSSARPGGRGAPQPPAGRYRVARWVGIGVLAVLVVVIVVLLARDTSSTDEVAARFPEGRFEAWVAQRTEQAFADGVEGTPTILVDGRLFEGDPYRPGSLAEAVEQAAP